MFRENSLKRKSKLGHLRQLLESLNKLLLKKVKNMGNLENTEKSGKSWSAEKIIRVKTFKTVVRHLVTQLPQTAAPPHPPHLCSSLSPYRSAKYIQRTQNVQRGLGCLKFEFLPFLPIFKKRYCVSKYKMSIVLVLYLYSYLQAGCVCVQGIWLPPQLQLC